MGFSQNKGISRGRDNGTYSWRWRMIRLLALVGALTMLALVATPATPAGADHDGGRHPGRGTRTGWGDDRGWGNGFQRWTPGNGLSLQLVASMIGAERADRRGADGRGIDVALIDTGVAPVPGMDRPGQIINGPDLSLDFQVGLPAGVDTFGHGTHMASIINGPDGIAPGARIVNVKAGSADGGVDVSQMIAAIDWVVQHRDDDGMNIRVISLSGGTDGVQPYQLDPLSHSVESAWHHGIVVVVAAGNSGGALVDPAVNPYVLTVGAADTGNPFLPADDIVAPFSSVGTAERGVDLVAPGVSILGLRVPGSRIDLDNTQALADPARFKGSGTSQAAAVTSGVVAQLLSARPDLTPDQVKALLRAGARDINRSPDSAQGAGMIQLRNVWRRPAPRVVQSFPRSTGMGTIEGARGTHHLEAADGTVLNGEIDLLGAPWNPAVWAPLASAGEAWDGGTWNGSVWAGGEWLPAGDPGSPLLGRSWRSELWLGRSWRADQWLSHTWHGHSWRNGAWV